jgi:hypothetical protein
MTPLVDLDDVAASERAKVWDATIKRHYLDLDIRFRSKLTPGGTIVQSRVGAMTLAAVSSVAQVHERTASGMSDDVDHLFGIMLLRGAMRLAQEGRDVCLTPGCLVMLDAAKAYRAEFDDYGIFVMKIPRLYFAGTFQTANDIVNVRVGERHGSMVVVDYFKRLARGYPGCSREQGVRMSAFGVELLVSAVAAAC